MTEILRSRDCIVFFKGDSTTVVVHDDMVQRGWPGGQGVSWVNGSGDDRVVSFARGGWGGFLVWGSDEDGDRFTGMTANQPHYRFATMLFGGNIISTSSYEKYTYASRLLGGPYVPLVYNPNDTLYLSLRGLWTKEDELTLSGDSMAPAFFAGYVAQIPKAANRFFLGVQTCM